MKEKTRVGIVGLGAVGQKHCESVFGLKNAELTAVCARTTSTAESTAAKYGSAAFTSFDEMIESDLVDAVIIATPPFSHSDYGVKTINKDLHLLMEKPVGPHVEDVDKIIGQKDDSLVFAAMFQQRTTPIYKEVRKLIKDGKIGEIQRVHWILSTWYRTQAYYDSGAWRGTWDGEGGGILISQCAHSLDILQWICGMPKTIEADCKIGKFHDIPVEDEVSAHFEYENGALGHFYTTSGEFPGTNRMEIAGDRGKVVVEGDQLTLTELEASATELIKTSEKVKAKPKKKTQTLIYPNTDEGPQRVVENFVNTIQGKEELIAPAAQGRNSVELANAMIYSSLKKQPVDLPLAPASYTALLEELIAKG